MYLDFAYTYKFESFGNAKKECTHVNKKNIVKNFRKQTPEKNSN